MPVFPVLIEHKILSREAKEWNLRRWYRYARLMTRERWSASAKTNVFKSTYHVYEYIVRKSGALLSDGVGEHTENRILLSWKEFVINTLSCRFFARTNYRNRKRENRHVENFGARENCDAKNSGKLYANARDPDPPKHFGRSRVTTLAPGRVTAIGRK